MKSCVAPDPLRPSSGVSHSKVPERRSEFVHGVWGKRWGQNNHPNLDHLRAFGSQRNTPPPPATLVSGGKAWERGRPAGTGPDGLGCSQTVSNVVGCGSLGGQSHRECQGQGPQGQSGHGA